LETVRRETIRRKTGKPMERQVLERHHLTEDSPREADVETASQLRGGCIMMNGDEFD